MNSLRIFWAQTSAVMSCTGIIATFFVKWSVSRRIYLLPLPVTGSRPRYLVATQSPGEPALRWPRGAFGTLVGFLSAAQTSQLLNVQLYVISQ